MADPATAREQLARADRVELTPGGRRRLGPTLETATELSGSIDTIRA